MLAIHRPLSRNLLVKAGRIILGPVTLLGSSTACDRRQFSETTAAVVQRDTIGDTIIARSSGPGVWGDSVQLIEELRIGDDDGDNYSFGKVIGITVDNDGTIYVADEKREDIRSFDSAGRFINKLGRKGKGPGEYLYIGGIAANSRGKLFMYDFGMARVNVYARDGKVLATLPCHGLPEPGDREFILLSTAGDIYIEDIVARDSADSFPRLSFVRCDSSGVVRDSLPIIRWTEWRPFNAAYDAFGVMSLNRRGELVSGFTGQYAIEVRSKDGKVFRIERVGAQSVPVSQAERHYLDSSYRQFSARSPRPRHNEPALKPVFKALSTGEDNRIWVTLYTPSAERAKSTEPASGPHLPDRWYEPQHAWDVFDPDGVYLGRITLPHSGEIFFRRGQQVWGKLEDENGTVYIIRWRIRPEPR
jgi:hypothetical protein